MEPASQIMARQFGSGSSLPTHCKCGKAFANGGDPRGMMHPYTEGAVAVYSCKGCYDAHVTAGAAKPAEASPEAVQVRRTVTARKR